MLTYPTAWRPTQTGSPRPDSILPHRLKSIPQAATHLEESQPGLRQLQPLCPPATSGLQGCCIVCCHAAAAASRAARTTRATSSCSSSSRQATTPGSHGGVTGPRTSHLCPHQCDCSCVLSQYCSSKDGGGAGQQHVGSQLIFPQGIRVPSVQFHTTALEQEVRGRAAAGRQPAHFLGRE